MEYWVKELKEYAKSTPELKGRGEAEEPDTVKNGQRIYLLKFCPACRGKEFRIRIIEKLDWQYRLEYYCTLCKAKRIEMHQIWKKRH